MSVPVSPERPARPAWRRRIAARLALAAAWPLVRFPPTRIQRVLALVRRGARPAGAYQVAAARDAVVAVSPRCAAGRGCLPRSLATALLCRMSGAWPTWCTGVRTDPFRAHAWVEAEGAPIGEPEEVSLYHKVITVPARRRARPSPGP
jgi:hypothetical protein